MIAGKSPQTKCADRGEAPCFQIGQTDLDIVSAAERRDGTTKRRTSFPPIRLAQFKIAAQQWCDKVHHLRVAQNCLRRAVQFAQTLMEPLRWKIIADRPAQWDMRGPLA